jgi:hypothetical protein
MVDIEIVRRRHADVVQRRQEIQREDAELALEQQNLEITERTLVQLASHEQATHLGALVGPIVQATQPEPEKAPRKPKDAPKIIDMACRVLSDAVERGDDWLSAPEITAAIRQRWWPNVETRFITPSLWKAANRNILWKKGPRYALPSSNEKGPTVGAVRPLTNGAA